MQVGKINTTPIYSEFHMGELETWVNCLLKYSPTVIDLMCEGESKWIQLPTMVLAVPVPKARQKQIDDDDDDDEEDDLLVTTISPSIHMPCRS